MASWKKRGQMITTIKIMRMIIRRPCCYHLQTAAGLVTCVCLPFAHRQVKMTIFPFRHSTLYFPTFSQFGRAFNSSRTREKREKLRLILTSFFFASKDSSLFLESWRSIWRLWIIFFKKMEWLVSDASEQLNFQFSTRKRLEVTTWSNRAETAGNRSFSTWWISFTFA